MTILTMGLSCVLFVAMANFAGNMDPEFDARKNIPHGQFQLELEYDLRDTAYPQNNLDQILKSNPLNGELIEQNPSDSRCHVGQDTAYAGGISPRRIF